MSRARIASIAAVLFLAPIVASADTMIDATQIPDGTYTVKVIQVVDAAHMLVAMDNGAETTLAAGRATVDFSKVKANDQVKLSLIKGAVMVYFDMGH